MDFRIKSEQKDLSDIFTALPAQYAKWMDDTDTERHRENHR
jgi:AsmA protein